MTFEDILNQTLGILERQGRVSYRALKRQFGVDDAFVEDLKFEITEVHKAAVDQDGLMLIWSRSPKAPLAATPAPVPAPKVFLPMEAGSTRPLDADAERRHLTVMFTDLVGSTALSETLDPEDLRDILHSYHVVSEKAIASFEGYIARYLGDGLLIYFGYPQAHEDDAVRAVRSGLRILEAFQRLNVQLQERWGIGLSVRIGIHTGIVVAGEMGAGEVRETMAIVGETPNVAARLQTLAEPDTLVISATTFRLVSGYFECRPLGTPPLKGISEPLAVYQVIHESAAKTRLDLAEESSLTPLMGRERELEQLFHAWEDARNGQARVVFLSGEAGIGKSRLSWELKKRISQEPSAWLTECQASPYYRNSAFYPVIDLLERTVLQFGRQETPEEKLTKIEGFLLQYGLDLSECVPLIASLLSVPFDSRYAPLNLSPEAQRQRTVTALSSILLARASSQPVLVTVEDLHWIDASTLDLITVLIGKAPSHRLMILLTSRPEFIPHWAEDESHLTLQLKNLTQAQTEAIALQLTEGKPLPREVIQQIVEKTDGIPLFVEELTKTVIESGLLLEKDGRYELSGPIPPLAIPATLHDSLVARLDRLSIVKEVAQLGATLAREFDYELIEAVAPWDAKTLRDGLEQLVQAELLFQHGAPPNATYKFKHALIQDAAYQSLLKSRRQQYHSRIAKTLESRFPEIVATQPELVAHHLTQANLEAQAIPYWRRAGQHALARAENLDAMAHLRRGVELVNALPESEERDRQELELLVGLAPAIMATRGWAAVEVEQTCLRACELSQRLQDGEKLLAALWGTWTNRFLRGNTEAALETAQAVYAVVQQSGVPFLKIPAHHAMGYTHYYRGEYVQAREHMEAGIALFDRETERRIAQAFQLSCSVVFRSVRASSLWVMGYPDQAMQSLDSAFVLAKELDHKPSLAFLLSNTPWTYHFSHDIARARARVGELKTLSEAEGYLLWLSVVKFFQGWEKAEAGQCDAGIALFREGLTLWHGSNSHACDVQTLTLLTELLIKAGRANEALQTIEDGLHHVETHHERHYEPELYRLRGEIRSGQAIADFPGHDEAAERDYQKAIAIAKEQSARMLELRAAIDLCRLWVRQGKIGEAQSLLTPLYGWFTEGFDSPDLTEARRLLTQWGGIS